MRTDDNEVESLTWANKAPINMAQHESAPTLPAVPDQQDHNSWVQPIVPSDWVRDPHGKMSGKWRGLDHSRGGRSRTRGSDR